ncbi:MAG: FAD-dependent monooxygenase [Pseudomonadota bacterium]
MHEQTQVLIVGGGPTGLLASILLSKYEIAHILVEQRETTLKAPAAHVVNTRTMEIYRQAGIDVDKLYRLNNHPNARYVRWNSRLQNESIGVFDAAENRATIMAQTHYSNEHTTNISQHLLEAFLREQAQKSEFADIRYATTWREFASSDQLVSTVQGERGQSNIHHSFLLAADGAGSPVARALDIKKVGPDAIATFLNLTCEVDLSAESSESETLLYWLLDPEVQGTVIVHDPQHLVVYMRPLAVPYESIDDFDEARCESILNRVFAQTPYKIRHKGVWKMTAQVADKFRVGSVFGVGDSVHRFPPTGGLGLNTGVGDVHNLVWKLAAVINNKVTGDQAEALLDSYEIERRPVAQRNCDVSKRNNDKMIEVIQALGLDPTKAQMLPKIMNSAVVRILPKSFQAGIYRVLVKPVKKILSNAENQETGQAVRERVARAIANQKEHFSSLGLDLGYVYREGCAVDALAERTQGSEVSTYNEVVGSGARLPDRQLTSDMGAGDTETKKRLHELLDYTRFTVFASGSHSIELPDTFGLRTQIAHIPADTLTQLGLDPDAWVLVRPDGHVMAVGSQ